MSILIFIAHILNYILLNRLNRSLLHELLFKVILVSALSALYLCKTILS
jgi:hypothetical protein